MLPLLNNFIFSTNHCMHVFTYLNNHTHLSIRLKKYSVNNLILIYNKNIILNNY